MKPLKKRVTLMASGAALLSGAWLVANFPGRVQYYGSSESIAAYLRSNTPVGSSSAVVTSWLDKQGVRAMYVKADIPANSSYPPTTMAGAGFIHSTIAEYGWPLAASIEAFYIFDDADKLADVRVRRTVDAP